MNPPYRTRALPLRPFAAPPLGGRVQSPAFRLSLANQHAKAWTLNTLAILRPDPAQRSKRDCAVLSRSPRGKAAKKIENEPRGKRADERAFSRFPISSFSRFPSIQSLAFSLFLIISAFYCLTAHPQESAAQRKTRIYNAACNHYNAGYHAMQDGQYNKALAEYNACLEQCKRFKKLLKKPRPVAEPLLEQIEEILDYIRMDIKDMDALHKKKGMVRYRNFYCREDRLEEAKEEVDSYEELHSLKIDADRSFNDKHFGPASKLYTSIVEKGAAIPSLRSRTGIDDNPLSPMVARIESLIDYATDQLEVSKDLKAKRAQEITELYEQRRQIVRELLPTIQREDLQATKTIEPGASAQNDADKTRPASDGTIKSEIRNPKSEIDLMEIISRKLAESYLRTADEYYQEGRYDMARAQYQKVFSEAPGSPAAQKAIERIIAICLDTSEDGLSQCHKWIPTLKDANQINCAKLAIAQYFYKRREYDKGLSELESVWGTSEPSGQNKEGEGRGSSDDRGEGVTVIPSSRHPVIQIDLRNEWGRRAVLLRALIYIAKGERENAIEDLRKITACGVKDNHTARAQFLVGWTFMAAQRYAEALEAYQELMFSYPHSRYTGQAKNLAERLQKLLQKY